MNLIGKLATIIGDKSILTIVTEPVLTSNGKFDVACINSNGEFKQFRLVDLTLIGYNKREVIEPIKDIISNTNEWQPDWSKFEGNYITFDTVWVSWSGNDEPDFIEDFDGKPLWSEVHGDCNIIKEGLDINYVHPNPSEAIYKRPN